MPPGGGWGPGGRLAQGRPSTVRRLLRAVRDGANGSGPPFGSHGATCWRTAEGAPAAPDPPIYDQSYFAPRRAAMLQPPGTVRALR